MIFPYFNASHSITTANSQSTVLKSRAFAIEKKTLK
jgi:hypothetical protein